MMCDIFSNAFQQVFVSPPPLLYSQQVAEDTHNHLFNQKYIQHHFLMSNNMSATYHQVSLVHKTLRFQDLKVYEPYLQRREKVIQVKEILVTQYVYISFPFILRFVRARGNISFGRKLQISINNNNLVGITYDLVYNPVPCILKKYKQQSNIN